MRMTTILFLLVGVLAAGCAPGATGEPPAAVQETPTLEPTALPPTQTSEPALEATATPEPPAVAEGKDPLAGTEWALVSFGPAGAEAGVVEGTQVTLSFDMAGNAGGNGGCNAYGTEYEVQGNQLSFGEIVSTLRACVDDRVMDQEAGFLAALGSADSFELGEERLTITYDGGRGTLSFVREGQAEAAPEGSAETALQLQELYMLNAEHGWARGRIGEMLVTQILFTADGGESWEVRTPGRAPRPQPGIEQEIGAAATFAPAGEGWVSYMLPAAAVTGERPLVWATHDGGQTWEPGEGLDLAGMPFEHYIPSDLGFLDEQFGWLLAHLGAGMSHDYVAIFTTADGGATWQRVADPERNPEIQACNKSGMVFTSERDGWLAGDCPGLMPPLTLYQTTDGGATWHPAVLPLADSQPVARAEELGSACGVRQMLRVAPGALLLSLHCFDFEQASSAAWLYRSDDNGESWQVERLPMAMVSSTS
jgi:heat shock protein HslJ